jgi:hypothetical protein
VLVVDEYPACLRALGNALRAAGAAVRLAFDDGLARELLIEWCPDVLVLDEASLDLLPFVQGRAVRTVCLLHAAPGPSPDEPERAGELLGCNLALRRPASAVVLEAILHLVGR